MRCFDGGEGMLKGKWRRIKEVNMLAIWLHRYISSDEYKTSDSDPPTPAKFRDTDIDIRIIVAHFHIDTSSSF